jgi:membrane protease YdiL (CAAX protease family)
MGREEKQDRNSKGYYTNFGRIFAYLTIGIMGYLGTKYIGSDREIERLWAMFAFLHMTYAICGGIIAPLLFTGTLNATRKIEGISVVRALIIFFAIIFYSGIVWSLSISATDKHLYHIFSAVSEELFYRGFLLNAFERALFKKCGKMAIWIGAIISSVIFMLGHYSYWGDPIKLLIVLGAGFVLCIFYILWKDLDANIGGHLFNNIISSGVFTA